MKSRGRPCVSYSRNATSPGTTPSPAAALSSTSSSRGSPLVSTASKRSSSLRMTWTTMSRPVVSSGYASPNSRTTRIDQRVEERLVHAEPLAVPHRAPHDLAQDVAAPLVRRHDAVRDEERHRAQVIRDHAHRDVGRLHRAAMSRRRRARRSRREAA